MSVWILVRFFDLSFWLEIVAPSSGSMSREEEQIRYDLMLEEDEQGWIENGLIDPR